MYNTSILLLLLVCLGVSLYGWGRLVERWCYGQSQNMPFYSIALGLAVWGVLGGILNAGGYAFPEALYLVLGAGLGLSAREYLGRGHPAAGSLPTVVIGSRLLDFLPVLLVIGFFAFSVYTLAPVSAFNAHDDLHTYFTRPYRMLQTGTMGGNPIALLGLDSLGLQTFYQAFILLFLPPAFLDGFDFLFCLLVGGLLVNTIGLKLGLCWIYRLGAVILFILVDPRSTNTSSTYSGSLMIGALILATLFFLDALERKTAGARLTGCAVLIGLTGATLAALKTTYLPFVACYLALLAIGCLYLITDRAAVAKSVAAALLAAVVLLVPWASLAIPGVSVLGSVAGSGLLDSAVQAGNDSPLRPVYERLLSAEPLRWRGNYFQYVVVLCFVAGILITAILRFCRKRDGQPRMHLLVLLSLSTATLLSFLAMPLFIRAPHDVIRYSSPVLVAALPIATLLLAHNLSWQSPGKAHAWRWVPVAVTVAVQAGLMSVFLPVTVERFSLQAATNSHLPYKFLGTPAGKAYLDYGSKALGEDARLAVRKLQSRIPEQAVILAWISKPFHLDFRRNRNLTLDTGGLSWIKLPLEGRPEAFRDYLAALGVSHVMWEYQGEGIRNKQYLQSLMRQASTTGKQQIEPILKLKNLFSALQKTSHVIMDNGKTVVLDIRKRPTP